MSSQLGRMFSFAAQAQSILIFRRSRLPLEPDMDTSAFRYFIVHKPFNMVSQFVSPDHVRLLGALDFDFPEGTHAIGRLDKNSEGLLILTTNKKVTKLLFQGSAPHQRTYLVQVRGIVTDEDLHQLQQGVFIEVENKEKYFTKPVSAARAECPPALYVPLSDEAYVPSSWLSIVLEEGKFHQVRKMVQAIHHPCRRLIRMSIVHLQLGDLAAGEVRELDEKTFFGLLGISDY